MVNAIRFLERARSLWDGARNQWTDWGEKSEWRN